MDQKRFLHGSKNALHADASLNPELHALVTKYQIHKCTIFQTQAKAKKWFITKCRFSFPRDVTEHAVLNPVEECLKSRKIFLSPSSCCTGM